MVALYITSILLTMCLTAYIVLKCVLMGLRWQIEANKGNVPTMEKNIIVEQIEKKQEQKELQQQQAQQLNILNEYLNGANGGDNK